MRLALALAGLALLFAFAPGASAAPSEDLHLVPEWPDSFQQARSEPIRLLPGPALVEERSHAPLLPGSKTGGTSHSFALVLENPDGSTGPAGDLPLDPQRPIVLDVYVSAGPSDDDLPTDTPIGDGPGLAPELTVDAQVEIADQTTDAQRLTATILTLPTDDEVAHYRLTFDLERDELPAGAGLAVDLSVYQIEEGEQQVTQPQWRIHTGTQHPTGLTVPLDPAPAGSDSGSSLTLQRASDASTDRVRQGAYGTLIAALAAAGWAARRGYRQLREE